MLARIKNILALGALCLGSLLLTAAPAAAQTRSFQVVNQTRYRIDHIYVSPTDYSRWGYDRLGDDVLRPGYQLTISLIPDFYDVKLVDQDGDSCVVKNVDFRDGDRWTLTDGLLVVCELATALR
jgi:hypothetical protein